MMKEKGEDIDAFLRRPNHLGFAISKKEAVVGLFLFIVIPDESYIEMYVGISKDEDAVEEMLDYLEKTYPGYRADFVFNPNWKIFREGLFRRNATFDVEQKMMVYAHADLDICLDGIEPYSDTYKEQYIELHNKDMYWTGDKTILAKQRFNIFLAIEDGSLVGYIDVTNCYEENEPYDLFVKPECRGKGIGTKLLAKALQENGARDMMLLVDVDNEAAIHLYQKVGFVNKEGFNMETAHLTID